MAITKVRGDAIRDPVASQELPRESRWRLGESRAPEFRTLRDPGCTSEDPLICTRHLHPETGLSLNQGNKEFNLEAFYMSEGLQYRQRRPVCQGQAWAASSLRRVTNVSCLTLKNGSSLPPLTSSLLSAVHPSVALLR